MIENPPVRKVFLTALTSSLRGKGFRVRILAPGSAPTECRLSATYLGRWSWDFVPYMATGEIAVFRDGWPAGDAAYSAPRGGWALTFGIYRSTESKVARMVDQLFPEGPQASRPDRALQRTAE